MLLVYVVAVYAYQRELTGSQQIFTQKEEADSTTKIQANGEADALPASEVRLKMNSSTVNVGNSGNNFLTNYLRYARLFSSKTYFHVEISSNFFPIYFCDYSLTFVL